MGASVSFTCFGPSCCLQLLELTFQGACALCAMPGAQPCSRQRCQGCQTPPALLREGEMVALGLKRLSAASCSHTRKTHSSLSDKSCGCAMLICHLVLGGEQGPCVSLEEPLKVWNGCSGGLGLPGHLPHTLWEGNVPIVGNSFSGRTEAGLAHAQGLQTIQGWLSNHFPPPPQLCTLKKL